MNRDGQYSQFLEYLTYLRYARLEHLSQNDYILFLHHTNTFFHSQITGDAYNNNIHYDNRAMYQPQPPNIEQKINIYDEAHPHSYYSKDNIWNPPPLEKKEIKKNKNITIERTIHSLQDLLDIVLEFPYDADTEYNIDLKSLHNIKDELKEINEMVGLATLKESLLDQLLYFIQNLHINREHDFKHMVIYGPPGTGKTHTAKLIGKMYSKMGILKNNVFRKVTRNDLVAGYLGQTAIKTNKVIQDCLGGCLFIDEVYSLGCGAGGGSDCGDSFSKECIDTLCEALSNYKDELMVIIAGYEHDVKEFFFKVNPGLSSRFIWRFTIEKYTPQELMNIFLQKVEQNGWTIDNISTNRTLEWFTKQKDHFIHLGRDMELLFTYTKIAHGRRIYGKPADLRKKLTIDDLDNGLKAFLKHNDSSSSDKTKMSESCFGLYV